MQSNKTEENPLQNKRKLCKKTNQDPSHKKSHAKNTNKTSCKKYFAKQDKKPCEQIQTTGNNQKRTPLQKEKTLQRKKSHMQKNKTKDNTLKKIPKQNSPPKNPNPLQKQNPLQKKTCKKKKQNPLRKPLKKVLRYMKNSEEKTS